MAAGRHGPRDLSVPDPADWQPTPEQVAADQRRDVAEAVKELGKTASVLAVAEAIRLHPSIVVRRLTEMGLSVPGMDWKPVKVPRSERQKANNMLK